MNDEESERERMDANYTLREDGRELHANLSLTLLFHFLFY